MNGLTFLFHWYRAAHREKPPGHPHRHSQLSAPLPFWKGGRGGRSFYPLVFLLLVALILCACGGKGVESEPEPEPRANHEEGDLVITLPFGIKMAFSRLEPGTFRMGEGVSLEHPGYDTDAVPAHDVTLTQPFYLGKYAVTRLQWASVMGVDQLPPMPAYALEHDYPVTNVSWEDCQAFVQRLNEFSGEDLYALPTEAQWEYACLADTTGMWLYPNGRLNGDNAWYVGNLADGRFLSPVGLKQPNPWGLYDMNGNSFEWVYDWFAPYSSEPQIDPRGPDGPPYPHLPRLNTKIRRSGFNSNSFSLRCAKRSTGVTADRSGFRVMRQATDVVP